MLSEGVRIAEHLMYISLKAVWDLHFHEEAAPPYSLPSLAKRYKVEGQTQPGDSLSSASSSWLHYQIHILQTLNISTIANMYHSVIIAAFISSALAGTTLLRIGTTSNAVSGPAAVIDGSYLQCINVYDDKAAAAESLYIGYSQTCCVYSQQYCAGDMQCVSDGDGNTALTGSLWHSAYSAYCTPSSNGGNFAYKKF